MVTAYVPEAGDIVFIDFDPQVGHEQAKRRPALVLTDQRNVRVQQHWRLSCRLSLARNFRVLVLPLLPNRCDRGLQVVRNGALLSGSLFH
jgi:PemK-like, MazF-like toxin of type II toxin-antitoxin system